jgi:tetratricopeptide (TPR) repeat protein
MKTIRRTLAVVLLVLTFTVSYAQRKITGVVYMNGKPQAGVVVEANKTSESFFTGFDGVYELTISEKTKFLKFTFLDVSKKLVIEGNASDIINFSLDGLPIPEDSEPGVNLQSIEQLTKNRDMDFLNNFSLYREFFKQNDYKSAMANWRIVYKTYPKSTTQIYIDGIKLYESHMDNSKDSHTKSIYLDTIMMIYDKRMKYLDNAGEILGMKAAKYLGTILQPSFDLNEDQLIEGIKKGYGFAEKSIKESGNNSEPAVLVLFIQSTRKLYASDEISKTTVIENYENAMSILETQQAIAATKEKAEQALPLVEKIIEECGVLDCKALIEMYEPKFKQNPNDLVFLKKMIRLLRKENCTDSELYALAAEKLYELEPSPDAAFNMANMFVKKSNYDKAFEYYEKAYSVTETEPTTRATYYYYAGMLALQRDRLQFARDMAREALKLKADYCEAYMLIGEVYGQSSKSFSTDDFERTTVFWIAVDYFEKASRIEACANDGNNKASFYSNYFPGKEEVFFRVLTVGQRYTVAGWINETTTVRVKK